MFRLHIEVEKRHEIKMSIKPPTWRSTLGWALFAFGLADRIVGWGGSIDFLVSRSSDPGWVGDMLKFIASIASYISFAMILIGVALIIWNERRRIDRILDANLSAARSAATESVALAIGPLQSASTIAKVAGSYLIAVERQKIIDANLAGLQERLNGFLDPLGPPHFKGVFRWTPETPTGYEASLELIGYTQQEVQEFKQKCYDDALRNPIRFLPTKEESDRGVTADGKQIQYLHEVMLNTYMSLFSNVLNAGSEGQSLLVRMRDILPLPLSKRRT